MLALVLQYCCSRVGFGCCIAVALQLGGYRTGDMVKILLLQSSRSRHRTKATLPSRYGNHRVNWITEMKGRTNWVQCLQDTLNWSRHGKYKGLGARQGIYKLIDKMGMNMLSQLDTRTEIYYISSDCVQGINSCLKDEINLYD